MIDPNIAPDLNMIRSNHDDLVDYRYNLTKRYVRPCTGTFPFQAYVIIANELNKSNNNPVEIAYSTIEDVVKNFCLEMNDKNN